MTHLPAPAPYWVELADEDEWRLIGDLERARPWPPAFDGRARQGGRQGPALPTSSTEEDGRHESRSRR